MNPELLELARRRQTPLQPLPTGETPRLPRLEGIRAVVFDVYGTLLISGSGDVGSADMAESQETAARAAMASVGLPTPDGLPSVAAQLRLAISQAHARQRANGVEFPEVDIVEIWRTTVAHLGHGKTPPQVDYQRLAVEFECRVNPVSAMPRAAETLDELRSQAMVLGIVSNAQFFTPVFWEASFGRSLAEMGVAPELQVFSFVHEQAKPGTYLYRLAAQGLKRRGLTPSQTLYVGNDMRNDVQPAGLVGFRTALFAGDKRSLRRRADDPKVARCEPDAVVTNLDQLLELVGLQKRPADEE